MLNFSDEKKQFEWMGSGTARVPWNKAVEGGMSANGFENPVLYNSIVANYFELNWISISKDLLLHYIADIDLQSLWPLP